MPAKKNHFPIRCFDGNAKPYDPFWTFVDAAESESGQAELELSGVISEYSWAEDDVTPAKFKNDLYTIGKGGPVLMKINSPGGDVIAASKMRAIMSDYPGKITARVDGIAASAAVLLTISAQSVKMLDSAYMMIHDPAVAVFLAYLDIETLGSLRDQLKTIKDGMIPAYAARTGLAEDKLARMMTNETWMTAREAVDFGFADEIIGGGQQQPPAKANVTNMAFVNILKAYSHVPPMLAESSNDMSALPISAPAPDQIYVNVPPAPPSSKPVNADIQRQAQSLRERVTVILQKEKIT